MQLFSNQTLASLVKNQKLPHQFSKHQLAHQKEEFLRIHSEADFKELQVLALPLPTKMPRIAHLTKTCKRDWLI